MSSTAPDENRFAPPTAHVEDISLPGLPLGGRGARLGAALIDDLLQGLATGLILFFFFPGALPSIGDDSTVRALGFQLMVGFAVFAVLHGYLLATSGQTVGKRLVGLRILRSDGSPASVGRLLGLRYLVGWLLLAIPYAGAVYAVVDVLMIFGASRRCLHDRIADTIVVEA